MSDRPISGARISISDPSFAREAVTDSAGRFLIPNVPPGSYRLEVTAPGYGVRATPAYFNPVRTESVLLPPNQQVRPGILLAPAATIRGRVLDENGHGIPDAPVEIMKVFTEADGSRTWTSVRKFESPTTDVSIRTNAQGRVRAQCARFRRLLRPRDSLQRERTAAAGLLSRHARQQHRLAN